MRAQARVCGTHSQIGETICRREGGKKRGAGFGTLYSPVVMCEAEETGHGTVLDPLQRPAQAAGHVLGLRWSGCDEM